MVVPKVRAKTVDDVIRRGELWLADIPGDQRRPVLILTRGGFICRLANVTVAPVVSRIRDIPTEIVVGVQHGIDHRSAVSLDNIITISKRDLVGRVGTVSTDELEAVCDAMRLALGCD
jgi:mRNA interferase MazF